MTRERSELAEHAKGAKGAKSKEAFDKKMPPHVSTVRAKSSGHKKVTADKWNQ
jgi:hypothetical protein